MRKIKEVLRLKFEADLSHDRIAAATGVSKGAATKYVRRAREVGLGWPLPAAAVRAGTTDRLSAGFELLASALTGNHWSASRLASAHRAYLMTRIQET